MPACHGRWMMAPSSAWYYDSTTRRRRRRRHGSGRRRMHWRTGRWVEVTNPIPQVKGGTLGMHMGTEREDVFAKDGSLPGPVCKVQIKGLNINWGCTVSRRLALRRSSKRETKNEYVASSLAVTHAAPAPLTGCAPAAAYAAPTPVTRAEATFEISGVGGGSRRPRKH